MRLSIVLLLALALAACDKQKGEAPQAQPQQQGAPASGIGKLDISHRGGDMPAIPFLGPTDGPATLTQYRGKPVLLNLWATWCAPCVAEMPTLDALAGREKDRMKVMVVSQDMEGRRAVGPFFAKEKFAALEPYLDKQNVLMTALKVGDTLPTTIFFDAHGKEQWRITGAMDWTGDKAKALIEGSLNGKAPTTL
ncbi:TlpA family protein disulfide reductase [Flavisphingomonas formosensis]|uniref:TlpA family protein disulfide reductase n=1 Tax=Flavisphingomonas formosensis TaxID=861534 RepID=UPI002FCD29AE